MSLVGTFDASGGGQGSTPSSSKKSDNTPSVRNSIYLGGKSDAKALEKLQARKIKFILNVTPAKSDLSTGVPNYYEKSSSKFGFKYLRVPIFDSSTSIVQFEQEYKEKVVDFISKGLFHGNVLVHCHHGVSRSTTCVVLYLMRKQGMTLDDAIAMIRRRRPQAEPIPPFMEFLRKEEETLKNDRATTKKVSMKRDCETKTDSNENETKKRKATHRVMGPAAGPTIGPTIGPVVGPAVKKSAVVGPSLPPEYAKPDQDEKNE